MEGALNCHNQPTKHFSLLRVLDLTSSIRIQVKSPLHLAGDVMLTLAALLATRYLAFQTQKMGFLKIAATLKMRITVLKTQIDNIITRRGKKWI